MLGGLDLKDRKILYELDLNARQSLSTIGKHVGLRPESVAYRINQLENKGIIRGYYSLINHASLGYLTFRVYIRLANANPQIIEEIIQYCVGQPEMGMVGEIENTFDIAIGIWVKSILDFDRVWKNFLKKYRKYVESEKISVFTNFHHFHRPYLVGKKIDEEAACKIGPGELVKYDSLDFELLKILSENARIPLKQLAEQLHSDPRTVAYRMKRLEKENVIQGYRPLLNLNALEIQYYKANISLSDLNVFDKLLAFCHSHPYITYVDETIGGWDFELDGEFPSKQAFFETMDTIKTKFPQVQKIDYFGFKRFPKWLYLTQR